MISIRLFDFGVGFNTKLTVHYISKSAAYVLGHVDKLFQVSLKVE